MQTAEEVEKHVPIREGDYGERVAAVEPGGVEYIALKERHGKPIDLFAVWLSPNLEFATVFVGVIAITLFGLNLWEAATAIIVGTLLGSVTHAVVSSWGQLDTARAVIQSSKAAVKSNEIALDSIRQEAQVGQRTTFDVLFQQQQLLNARVALVTAQRDRVVASYSVMAAIGRLSAANLNLSVAQYDPTVHFDQVKDNWIGLRTPDGR